MWTKKGIWKKGLGTKKPVFTQFLEHLENPDSFEIIPKIGSYLEKSGHFEIIQKIGNHLENPDSFEIIRKIGSHLQKSGQIWNHPENWKSSRKLEIIWDSLKGFFLLYAQKTFQARNSFLGSSLLID